jgi:hypothetical protein
MDWTIHLDGLVSQAHALDCDEDRHRRTVEKTVTVVEVGCCPQNLRIDNAVWEGVPFSDLLAWVGVLPTATYAQCRAADGYSTYLRLDQLKDALLAHRRNGIQLTQEQGFPVRLVVPGVYGYKMPKWIQRIQFVDRPLSGTRENQGWSPDGSIQTAAYIQSPRHREALSGPVEFSGIAFAGAHEIVAIEVSVDDAPWTPIPFTPGLPGSWTTWRTTWWPLAPGDYQVKVRATDSAGFTQIDDPAASPFPNGWRAIHSIVIRVVP